jgi:hypothetical protein
MSATKILLAFALEDGKVNIRFNKNNPAVSYGHDTETIKHATVEDLLFKRDTFKYWADKVALGENQHDHPKAKGAAKSRTEDEHLHPRSEDSLKRMIIGMAIAKTSYP